MRHRSLVPFPGVLGSYLNLLQMARRGDILCVTSNAARHATKELLDQASELLQVRNRSLSTSYLDKIRLVDTPLAIDDSWIDPMDRLLARRILGCDIPDRYIVLYFGRISREYKADLSPLLLAFRKLLRVQPDAMLIIAGSSIHAGRNDDLQGILQQYGLSDCVLVFQNVAPAFKRVLFHCADVFVAPSDNIVESFGLSILEAMATGLPVIASDWSGYRDLVQDGKTGFLIATSIPPEIWPAASALAEFAVTPHAEYFLSQRTVVNVEQLAHRLELLAARPELRCQLGSNGHRRVRSSYLWSKAILRFGSVWHESIAMADQDQEQHSSEPLLDLERVFGGYASLSWTDGAPRFLHRSSLVDDQFLDQIPMDPETRAILTYCSRTPALFSHPARFDGESRQRIVWLLKQGFLSLSPYAVLPQSKLQADHLNGPL